MVLKYTRDGIAYRQPPYSKEEDAAFYKRIGSIQSLTVVSSRPASEYSARQPKEPSYRRRSREE